MFFNRFCRSVRKLFDNNMEFKEMDNLSKCEDTVSTDEFKDCDEEVMANDNEVVLTLNNKSSNGLIIDTLNKKSKTKESFDWNEMQEMESDSNCSSSIRSMIKTSRVKNSSAKPKDFNRLLEKWGESVGIFDESTGAQKRLVPLSELNNFFELKLSSLNCSDCLLLCSLINSRYPRFYTSTVNYYQRWRMRYNIFVASDALITTEEPPLRLLSASDSVADIPTDQLVLHIGEIHLYFDVVPKYCQPVYVNSSFYANKSSINPLPNVVLNPNVMTRISRIVNSIRYSKDIFQFKFPLSQHIFYRKNQLFEKFTERQMEFIEETVKVFRKNEQKNKKFHNWSQKQLKYRQRLQTRDQFAYDYDTKHKSTQEYVFENQNNFISYSNKSYSRNEPKVSINRSLNQTMAKINGTNSEDNDSKMEWNDVCPSNR